MAAVLFLLDRRIKSRMRAATKKEPRLSSGGAGGAERCHEAGNTENKGTFECTAHTASS